MGIDVLAFVIPAPSSTEVEEAAIASGTASLSINGQELIGGWKRAILESVDPPNANVKIYDDEGTSLHRQAIVHVDQLRPMQEGPGADEDEIPLRPADATRVGQRVSDVGGGRFNIETCNDEYVAGALWHAITHTHLTSSLGHASLVVEFLPEASLGNISKRTCVLRVKATTLSQIGQIVLAPFGGTIVELRPDVNKANYKMLNPA